MKLGEEREEKEEREREGERKGKRGKKGERRINRRSEEWIGCKEKRLMRLSSIIRRFFL
jgi:hypothetical protein